MLGIEYVQCWKGDSRKQRKCHGIRIDVSDYWLFIFYAKIDKIFQSKLFRHRMVKKTLPELHESLNIIEKTQVDDHCDSIYECDSDKDGRNF